MDKIADKVANQSDVVIQMHLEKRPCLVGREKIKAFFYGFTNRGMCLVEVEGGRLYHWLHNEVQLLDSQFERIDWDAMIERRKLNNEFDQ